MFLTKREEAGKTMKQRVKMKKRFFGLILVLIMLFSAAGCNETINSGEHLEDYVFNMAYHDNFNILQLTDIHWNMNTSAVSSKAYLDKVLKETNDHIVMTQGPGAKIDLVELTGDMFMLANNYQLNTFIDYFEQKAEEYGFIYVPIWGNHDRQCLFNPQTLEKRFNNAPHCFYYEPDDELYGRSNFIINLTEDGSANSDVDWMIVHLDSGSSFSETEMTISRDYDYIRPDQTEWFLKEHAHYGEDIPVIAYYHIPQDENEKAWKAVTEEGADIKNKFFKLEEFGDNGHEEHACDFIDKAKEHNLKAAFMGHAHNADWTYEQDGVVVGLGVKTGDELYFVHIDAESEDEIVQMGLKSVGITEDFDLLGASLVTITDKEGSFDLEHLYYNERKDGDFVKWVKW